MSITFFLTLFNLTKYSLYRFENTSLVLVFVNQKKEKVFHLIELFQSNHKKSHHLRKQNVPQLANNKYPKKKIVFAIYKQTNNNYPPTSLHLFANVDE